MTISATVTISSVHPGPSGGAILSGRDTAGTRLRFVADRDRICRAPVVGEVWSLEVPIFERRLLDRTLIYTAVTRGVQQVVFIGDRNAFDVAVAAPPHSHERQVGFSMQAALASA